MIRCPNLRDDKGREAFNGVLERLGGLRMSADDVTPRQPYLARLNEGQTRAFHIAHYLWNAHKTPAEIGKFLDALEEVQKALAPSNQAEKSVEGRETAKPPNQKNEADQRISPQPSENTSELFHVKQPAEVVELKIKRPHRVLCASRSRHASGSPFLLPLRSIFALRLATPRV